MSHDTSFSELIAFWKRDPSYAICHWNMFCHANLESGGKNGWAKAEEFLIIMDQVINDEKEF